MFKIISTSFQIVLVAVLVASPGFSQKPKGTEKIEKVEKSEKKDNPYNAALFSN